MTEVAERPQDLTFSAPEAKGRAHKILPAEALGNLQLLSTNPRFIDRPKKGFGLYIKPGNAPIVVDFAKRIKEGEFDLDKKSLRRFSFIAVKTSPISQENQTELEELLKKAAKFLSIQTGDASKNIEPRSASIFVIEERGPDAQKNERLKTLKNVELSRPDVRTGDTNGPILWIVSRRRNSIRKPIDTTQTAVGPQITSDRKRNEDDYARQGIGVDASVLDEEIVASRMVPATRERTEGFRGVTFRDNLTGDIITRTKMGTDVPSIVSSEDEREVAAAGREEQQRVDAVRRANRNVNKTTAPKPDSSIKNAIDNPGRSFTSDRLKCNRKDNHNPNFPAYLYRKVESVKGTNFLFNICPTHGVISKGIAPKLEK